MTEWMIKNWAALGKVVIFLGTLCLVHYNGYRNGLIAAADKHRATLAAINAEHTKQLAIAIDAARKVEQAKAQGQADIAAQLLENQKNEIDSRDRIISDLRAGTVQLRKRFTCPASASGDVPSTATSATGSDGAQAGGLQNADAEFLIRIATEADVVAQQLAACQALVRLDRE